MTKLLRSLILTSLSCLLVTASCLGQQDPESAQEVTVYLKNGKYVHGYEALSPFQGFYTVDVDQFSQEHIPRRQIDYIHYGPPLPQPPPPPPVRLDNTFFFSVAAGIQFGKSDLGNNRAAASFAVGYIFNDLLQPSVGVGFEQYDPIVTTTFFAGIRGMLTDKRWSPYYFAEIGASRATTRDWQYYVQYHNARGGLMIHTGMGYQRTFRHGAIYLGLGYRVQNAELEYSVENFWGGNLRVQERLTYKRVTTMIGLIF